jgi:SagB-type dehydrogenase family enzyme
MPQLPQEILDRVERVLEFHRTTKIVPGAPLPPPPADPSQVPPLFRKYASLPEVKLPTTLLDAPANVIQVLQIGRDALPESLLSPPQDLKTLATWLFLSNGLIPVRRQNKIINYLRTCPSAEGSCPFDLYFAAFSIEGLDAGLYHFNPQTFSLRKLRGGASTLSLIKRGRPDLDFIKSIPGVLLVATTFSRSTARFTARGYRNALVDSGAMIENAIVAANSLGMQTMTRLRISEANARDLLGISPQTPYSDMESIVGMIMWTDVATTPHALGAPDPAEPAPPRESGLPKVIVHDSLLAAHEACTATGLGIREIRPPATDTCPLPSGMQMFEKPVRTDQINPRTFFRTVANRRSAPAFVMKSINRDPFLLINQTAFQGGTYYPISPDGAHVGLVRPFWLISDVTGMDPGIWYYHPPTNKWAMLAMGVVRRQIATLSINNPLVAAAAAVCVLTANVRDLCKAIGPDVYRLANLEAGIAAHRMHLVANSIDLGCRVNLSFFDDELRRYLALDQIGWEILGEVSVGVSIDDAMLPSSAPSLNQTMETNYGDWRD